MRRVNRTETEEAGNRESRERENERESERKNERTLDCSLPSTELENKRN